MELERDVDSIRHLLTDRVKVHVPRQHGAGRQLHTERIGIDRRVLSQLPDDVEISAGTALGRRGILAAAGGDHRVVDYKQIEGRAAGLFRRRRGKLRSHFPELHRLDVPVLGQPGRDRLQRAEVVGSKGLEDAFTGRHDEVRRSDCPAFREGLRRWKLRRVAQGRSLIDPG